MSQDNKSKIQYCVYCGEDVGESKTYCPNCGKLIVKLKSNEKLEKSRIIHKPIQLKTEISRKCPECGSVITSTILDQCPICNTTLEKLPESKKVAVQKKPALIFTNKKLEPEQKYIIKKDTWNLREGINVFTTCIYIYIISFFLIYFLFIIQGDGGSIEQTIQVFIISQIPEVLIALYPIYYILSKNHNYNKLGFERDLKKILKSVIIGLIGAFSLIMLNLLYNTLISTLGDFGLDFFDAETDIIIQNQIIRDADFIWVFLLIILIALGAASLEIVYRGVLHNALNQKFRNEIYTILLVALIHSVFMVLIYPNPTYFLLDFLVFSILGVLWEMSNRNIYCTLVASVLYNIIPILLIFS
jgi:membrane protease YdiL (CAAX protease family)